VPQDIAALLAGKIYIENDQGWTRRAFVALGRVQEAQGFLAVLRHMDFSVKLRGSKRIADQEQIRPVILNDKDVPPRLRGLFRRG
jgi:hypothetical protein